MSRRDITVVEKIDNKGESSVGAKQKEQIGKITQRSI
jgi:hypothetical protein